MCFRKLTGEKDRHKLVLSSLWFDAPLFQVVQTCTRCLASTLQRISLGNRNRPTFGRRSEVIFLGFVKSFAKREDHAKGGHYGHGDD